MIVWKVKVPSLHLDCVIFVSRLSLPGNVFSERLASLLAL